ncbi:carbohydrate ABC transporter permease [Truepera radiovictrix]|uniref:Binding-protein-dependent transport systems inner membrane component n=1 Tax=Truepera radiovictrix (strain DSM 17093 / CIP 108686 / LMG 22925 / RQ-24) TaxID=649638 RepID=D7CT89_TRURR|nr:carbohydrate ABC transporter permease [Truepera radiovictrix]ADI15552.1 binding-protein-dependent transport systems inner membrane component [Truepera radiovictrix DSM 17093]WMT58819.1 carbohydrate ABC transporter permease [Truepera radiovictrix]
MALFRPVARRVAAERAHPQPPRLRLSLGRAVAWLLLAGIAFLFLVPLLWMISTSLKTPADLVGNRWIPSEVAWENYRYAFAFGMWVRWTVNTLIITFVGVVGMVLSCALVAYAFARLRWPGRDLMFGLVLATMMLPGVVTLIPQFILFAHLPAFGLQGSSNWVNTFLPLVAPPILAGSSFNIFLLRQFMRGVPMELSESAKIDGASELRIFWSIVLPLSKPALATVAIFTFQGAWQDFLRPLLYLQSERLYTLQLGLRQFEFAAGGAPAWNWMMAASLVVMLPVLIVFLVFQPYFMKGISITGTGDR